MVVEGRPPRRRDAHVDRHALRDVEVRAEDIAFHGALFDVGRTTADDGGVPGVLEDRPGTRLNVVRVNVIADPEAPARLHHRAAEDGAAAGIVAVGDRARHAAPADRQTAANHDAEREDHRRAAVDRGVVDADRVEVRHAVVIDRLVLYEVDVARHAVLHEEVGAEDVVGDHDSLLDVGRAPADLGQIGLGPLGAAPDVGIIQLDRVAGVKRPAREHGEVERVVGVADRDRARVADRDPGEGRRIGGGHGGHGHGAAAFDGDVGNFQFRRRRQHLGIDVLGIVLRIRDRRRTGQIRRQSVSGTVGVSHNRNPCLFLLGHLLYHLL